LILWHFQKVIDGHRTNGMLEESGSDRPTRRLGWCVHRGTTSYLQMVIVRPRIGDRISSCVKARKTSINSRSIEVHVPVSQRIQKLVWGMFAGRCAICRQSLVWKGQRGNSSLTGEIAHIIGAKPSAARGRAQPIGGRDDPDNLILLCREHHKVIDDNEGEYPPERLQAIKSDYLSWLEGQLAEAQTWSLNISQYSYLNVPRLDEFAALLGYRIKHEPLETGAYLSSLGYDLNYLMNRFRTTLESMPIRAIPAEEIEFPHEGYIGQIVSFERLRFRTKNLPEHRPKVGPTNFSGSLDRDPHIYHAFPHWRFVINVDPRWITTATAYGLFRPPGGSSVLSGFARINSVDYENGTMTTTGLAIGLPPSVLDKAKGTDQRDSIDLAQFEDDETKAQGGIWHGTVDSCQVCGRVFEEGDYMIDGPPSRGGPWANICGACFLAGDRRLGSGYGQLYRKSGPRWLMVGGNHRPTD
jgi:hypothetical protein